ncbi:MAG: carboxypeptidase-like regulatory domain-containing protein [Acidobacteria bacterium]|nr:carboxypeptidase-like regulatory domain-containing protein [Acidobacteriota bacterium]
MKLFHRLTPLGLVLVASASLIAQEGTGTLVGTVRGDGGKFLAGARIIIASPNMLQTRVISTNDKGEFRVPLLPPSSSYTVTVTADGYVSRKADGLTIPAGGTIRQDLNLKSIASAGASVEVVAISSSVDKTETKIVSTYTEEALQNLPTGNLNSYGALAVSPGVSGSVGYPVIRGGITGESQFMVNGISVRDPLVRQGRQFEKVIDDLTQDVQVILSPMNAKYGFTSAGITNIVTKLPWARPPSVASTPATRLSPHSSRAGERRMLHTHTVRMRLRLLSRSVASSRP